jgi:hypothetical protein
MWSRPLQLFPQAFRAASILQDKRNLSRQSAGLPPSASARALAIKAFAP